MALIKSKVGNTTYSWKSDDVRDAEINAITNVYGAKNLLPNTATSQTLSGVTFTVNVDGSVTVNGTATAFIDFTLCDYKPLSDYGLKSGMAYILSGTPIYYESENVFVMLGVNGTGTEWRDTTGNGVEFTPSDVTKQYRALLLIREGTTVNNLTFYPMIRDARITDNSYVPYAMTNRELTERVIKRTTCNITIPLNVYTGGSECGINASRIVSLILEKNEDTYSCPVEVALYPQGSNPNGRIELRRIFQEDTAERNYTVYVMYI